MESEEEKVQEDESLRKAARTAAFHAEARKVEAVAGTVLVEKRIESGELVEAKFWQPARGV